MPAITPYCCLTKVSLDYLTKSEADLFEADLFCILCEGVKGYFKEKYYQDIFRLMKLTKEGENLMLESDFLKTAIHDILETNEYTLSGIAYYTNTPEEVIVEVLAGLNQRPSAIFMRRIIDLHRLVRKDLYKELAKKISLRYKNI